MIEILIIVSNMYLPEIIIILHSYRDNEIKLLFHFIGPSIHQEISFLWELWSSPLHGLNSLKVQEQKGGVWGNWNNLHTSRHVIGIKNATRPTWWLRGKRWDMLFNMKKKKKIWLAADFSSGGSQGLHSGRGSKEQRGTSLIIFKKKIIRQQKPKPNNPPKHPL